MSFSLPPCQRGGYLPVITNTRSQKIRDLKRKESKLTAIIRQIRVLDEYISGLNFRINAARRDGNHCFRYTLRMRIGVYEGVRNMMYEYARSLAIKISDMRRLLFNQHAQIDDVTDSGDEEAEPDDSEAGEISPSRNTV